MKLALAKAAKDLSLSVEVGSKEHEFRVPEWRSQAGVDLAYYVRHGLRRTGPAFVELKWGDGRRKVGECVWDLAKMGLARALGKAPFAALVAGAPTTRWSSGIEGTELFATDEWPLEHLRAEPYLTHYWQKYADEPLPQPQKLPASFATRLVASPELVLAGKRWELRAIVVSASSELRPVERLPVEGPVR